MTNAERQLTLETMMYKNGKTFGREKFCKQCWACYHGRECIAASGMRSTQILCVKAKDRAEGNITPSSFLEAITEKRRKKDKGATMESKKIKRPNILKETRRLPTIQECESCEYQDLCEGGRFCISSKDKKREEKKF